MKLIDQLNMQELSYEIPNLKPLKKNSQKHKRKYSKNPRKFQNK
jgi:hypothetical protein